MLIDNRETLRRIVVSSQLIPFRDISTVSWPLLESLELTQFSPPETRYPDTTSIPALTQNMPKLKELHLLPHVWENLWSGYGHSVTQQRPRNLPAETTGYFGCPLQNIIISNLDTQNSLLHKLPWGLKSVTILSAYYPQNSNSFEECGLKLDHASQALEYMSALEYDEIDECFCPANPVFHDLYILLNQQPSVDLVRIIAIRLPLLKRLELGITHYNRPYTDQSITQDEYRRLWVGGETTFSLY